MGRSLLGQQILVFFAGAKIETTFREKVFQKALRAKKPPIS